MVQALSFAAWLGSGASVTNKVKVNPRFKQ